MSQPRDIHDQPGPLPGEPDAGDVIEELDDTDPNVLRAATEHPGLDMGAAWWDEHLAAVIIPRDQLERVENPLRWEVRVADGDLYVLAYHDRGVTLAALEPAPVFEGTYLASRPPHRARCA